MDRRLEARHALDPESRPLVRERALRDPPTVVQCAHEVVARDDEVTQEHLGEVRGAADVPQRPDVDAGRVHVEDEETDALVLRRARIGPHVAEAFLRRHRVARPHLLTVHDEMVVVHFGPGGQARKVRARVRLTHADAPDRVAADRRRHELTLLITPEFEKARGDDRVPGEVQRPRDAAARHLLQVDERLHRGAVPAAELRWVRGDHPAVVEQRRLPRSRPRRDEVDVVPLTRIRVIEARVRLVRHVLVEELDELGAERLLLGTPRELQAYRPVNRGSRRSLNAAMPSTRSPDVVASDWYAASRSSESARSVSKLSFSKRSESPSARVGPAARRVASADASASSSSGPTHRYASPRSTAS